MEIRYKLVWLIIATVILGSLVYATTTITNNGLSTPAIDNTTFTGTWYNFSSMDTSLKLYTSTHNVFGNDNGESIELHGLLGTSKPYIGWFSFDPTKGYDYPVGWIGCHYNLSNGDIHKHCSFETLDNSTGSPSINTKFEISYGATDKVSVVNVNQADFLVNGATNISKNAAIKLAAKTTIDNYPFNQNTYAFRISNTSSAIALSGLGTNDIQIQDNVTITNLAGSGNAFACLDANGKLYRSAAACA